MKSYFILLCAILISSTLAARINWTDTSFKRTFEKVEGINGRIIGGTIANRGEIAYQAGVMSDDRTFCAGALVTDSIVLTAAHCIDGRTSHEVHLGADYIFNPSEPGHVVVTSLDATLHPLYNGSVNFDYDLAFIRLPQPVSGEYIEPVNLPSLSQSGETFANKIARTSGWGHTDDLDPNLSEQLRYADVLVTSMDLCQFYYGSVVVSSCHVCASTHDGTLGICSGDSGAPLTYTDDITGEKTLIGIASFGHPLGCEKDAPNVYVRLSCYIDWLEQEAGIPVRP